MLAEAHGKDIIALCSYYLDAKTNLTEVAFVMGDKWQNMGIGTFLLKHLTRLAWIRGFTAEVASGE